MRQASKRIPESAEKTVRDIRRATRRIIPLKRRSTSCWKACVVRSALLSSAAKRASRRACITVGRKSSLEAGKKRLAGDTARQATSDEVKELRAEARQLKEQLPILDGYEATSTCAKPRPPMPWPVGATCRDPPDASRRRRRRGCGTGIRWCGSQEAASSHRIRRR
jgi:transposase